MKKLYATASRTRAFWVFFIIFSNLLGRSVFAEPNQSLGHQDYLNIVAKIEQVMQAHHYKPDELLSKDYQATVGAMKQLATRVESKQEFVRGFNEIWQSGPFSHVNMVTSEHTAQQMASYLDTMRVGGRGAQLTWHDKVPILTVNTMMGIDTIEQIKSAYQEIHQNNAKALIIDLRSNEGGAFATRPLVSHLINTPLEAGYFISQKWTAHNARLPSSQELKNVEPWNGWSIVAFWNEVQKVPVIKAEFQPASLTLKLPVYVLISQKTSSAAEFATEALQSVGRVTVIGEPSAGKMLSQKPFDLSHQLQLFIPIADYYSMKTGRIEGNPIQPDVLVKPDQALKVAKQLIETL